MEVNDSSTVAALDNDLMTWNDTVEQHPTDRLVHELLEAQATRTPDRIAVEYGEESLTYAELDHRAQALANALLARGVGPDSIIGLCVEKSARMVIGVFGILKSGAAYLPLEPTYPDNRLVYMLKDARAEILVHDAATAGRCSRFEGARVLIDDTWQHSLPDATRPAIVTRADNLAYVIYTSGSTGTPKGVAIEHRSITNLLFSMSQRLRISNDEVVLSVAPFSFDVALPDWCWALMFGGKVILVEGPVIHDAELMIKTIHSTRPTHIQGPPTFWEMLVAEGTHWPRDIRLVSTGEHMSDALRIELRDRNQDVWNLYGPTETTVWSCACDIHEDTNPNSIGRPIGNTTLHLLNERGELAEEDDMGELFIGGAGLARGYINQAELTRERFSAIPQIGTDRLYRTGDLARRKPDGTFEYLGRKDHQVKIRGFRVELGEIDAALQEHPDVRSAVTVLREDRPGEKRLYSYIVRNRWRRSKTRFWEYRDFLEQALPTHMIPAGIEVLKEMPLNQNGKIDRAALPAPATVRRELSTPYVAPVGELENRLASIWEEVLKIEGIGAEDNLFDMGGHSITAMKIAGHAAQAFNTQITIASVFGAPTVRAFSRLLQARGDGPP